MVSYTTVCDCLSHNVKDILLWMARQKCDHWNTIQVRGNKYLIGRWKQGNLIALRVSLNMDSKHMLRCASLNTTLPHAHISTIISPCTIHAHLSRNKQTDNYRNLHTFTLSCTNTGKRGAQPLTTITLLLRSRSSTSLTLACSSPNWLCCSANFQQATQEAAVVQTEPQAARSETSNTSKTDASER